MYLFLLFGLILRRVKGKKKQKGEAPELPTHTIHVVCHFGTHALVATAALTPPLPGAWSCRTSVGELHTSPWAGIQPIPLWGGMCYKKSGPTIDPKTMHSPTFTPHISFPLLC